MASTGQVDRPEPKGAHRFTLGQDDSVTASNMLSTFKKDFPTHPIYQKGSGCRPPPLGRVMHVDERFFNDKASETVKSFEHFYLPKPVLMGEASRLNATNFKMDKDLSKFQGYNTTHQDNFPPQATRPSKVGPSINIYASHIHLGDREKEHLPMTDYRDRFPGIDTNVHRIRRAACMHDADSAPIRGDTRPNVDSYATSSTSDFPNKSAPKVETLPVAYFDHIPRGDPEKEVTWQSTMRASFNPSLINPQPPMSRASSGIMRRTNFRDGDDRVTEYNSMAMESFVPKEVVLDRPSKIRNASFVPQGDLDPVRAMLRTSTTTNRFYLGQPHKISPPTIVKGSDIMTKSGVQFGEPPLNSHFYNPTTKDTFGPKAATLAYKRPADPGKSYIPLDYYSKEPMKATTRADFPKHDVKRTLPNPEFLSAFKNHHFNPLGQDMMEKTTTHMAMFTPKEAEKYTFDRWRMQVSSVPLGTMSQTKPGLPS